MKRVNKNFSFSSTVCIFRYHETGFFTFSKTFWQNLTSNLFSVNVKSLFGHCFASSQEVKLLYQSNHESETFKELLFGSMGRWQQSEDFGNDQETFEKSISS